MCAYLLSSTSYLEEPDNERMHAVYCAITFKRSVYHCVLPSIHGYSHSFVGYTFKYRTYIYGTNLQNIVHRELAAVPCLMFCVFSRYPLLPINPHFDYHSSHRKELLYIFIYVTALFALLQHSLWCSYPLYIRFATRNRYIIVLF